MRFGVYSEDAPGGGSRVTRVVDNSPADWAGFRQGIIIQEITPYDFLLREQEMRTIHNDADFLQLLDSIQGPQWLRCRVLDGNTGQSREIRLKLSR